MLRRTSSILSYSGNTASQRTNWYSKGTMRGGVPRITYGWMKPGSFTRRQFEKRRNPFVDLDVGQSIYFRDQKEPIEAAFAEADARGIKGMDNAVDLYNENRIVPDLYPEGFQWKHKLNTEYNQWRSNTWVTPDLIPIEHRGRFLCNFQLHITQITMRIAKFSPKDHRQWILCSLFIGSGKGLAGCGAAMAPSVSEAKKEAIREAFSNIQGFDLEQDGVMYPVRINLDGVRVTLYPSEKLAGNLMAADIFCAFGIAHCGCKVGGNKGKHKPRNPTKRVAAIFEALRVYKSVSEIAAGRGKIPHSLVYNIFPYLEEMRRRKGMMAMSPKGKDGLLMPDRVVDNRMPDHLKKGYYDDVYWKDFFAGNTAALSEPKMGLRSDRLRSLAPANPPKLGGVSTGGNQRRTLNDFLSRVGKTAHDLGQVQVANPHLDAKLATHMRQNFHLH